MPTSEQIAARARLAATYNGNAYNSSTNPGGLAQGGHRQNLVPAMQDIALVAEGVAADAANTFDIILVDTISDLRAQVTTGSPLAVVRGGLAVDDGGAAYYIFNASSTATDDGVAVVKPSAITAPNPGRWLIMFEPVSVRYVTANYTVNWAEDETIRIASASPLTVTIGLPTTGQRGREIEILADVTQPLVAISLSGFTVVDKGGDTISSFVLTQKGEYVRLRALNSTTVQLVRHNLVPNNAPRTVRLFEQFLGKQLDTAKFQTALGSNGTCAAAVVNGQVNGLFRATFGADAGGTMALNGAQLVSDLNWRASDGGLSISAKVKPSNLGNVAFFIGFTDNTGLEMPFTLGAGDALTSNATDAVGWLFDTAADTDNWWLVGVAADVDATKQNYGAPPVAGSLVELRVDVSAAGVAYFYRNKVLVGTAMTGAVNPSALLTPYVGGFSRSATSKSMDVIWLDVQKNY